MKKILIITIIMTVALLTLVGAAVPAEIIVETSGDDCDCGDAVIKLNEWANTIEAGGTADGTYTDGTITITITDSNLHNFTWESDMQVCAVMVKPGNDLIAYPGGMTGTVNDTNQNAISHVSFCYDPDYEIPEFPAIAIPIAAIIGLAFIMQRRKE